MTLFRFLNYYFGLMSRTKCEIERFFKKASFKDYLCNASDYLKGQINGIKLELCIKFCRRMRRNDSTLLKSNNKERYSRILLSTVLYKFSEYIKFHNVIF